MPRVKVGVTAHRRHKKILKLAKTLKIKLTRGLKGAEIKAMILEAVGMTTIELGTLEVGSQFMFKTKKTICTVTAKENGKVTLVTEDGRTWKENETKAVIKF